MADAMDVKISDDDVALHVVHDGAIVVRDPTVAAFLEQLGQLLAHPERFCHEPTFARSPRSPGSEGELRAAR